VLRYRTAQKILLLLTIFAVMVLANHVYRQPMDFRVYHFGARGVFNGTRPVYGLTSGLGWPMHYRYPPLFLLLFAPFALLPLGPAAVVWVILKVVLLVWLVQQIWKTYFRFSPPLRGGVAARSADGVVPILLIAPYLIEEFRYGNAQFFIVALTSVALLFARGRPMIAGGSLALAISIKVWPVFFLPYLAVRRDWKVVAGTLVFVLVLALLPSFYFGWSGNIRLLEQWFGQEFHTQFSENEIWFPNQSLRGTLMRYLTFVDYSQVPDTNYPQVNIADISSGTVRLTWMIIAGILYSGFLMSQARRRNKTGFLDHGLAFCLVALLEPFTQKYALAVLLWPAMSVMGLMHDRWVRVLVYIATILALIQPLTPGASAQRLLQVLGFDFAVTSLLALAIFAGLNNRCNKTLTIQE
jgi:glycosyl transferase family 87